MVGGYVADESDAPKQTHQMAPKEIGEGAGIRDLGWNWTAVQLDDGMDITAYEIIDVKGTETVGKWMVMVDPESRQTMTDLLFRLAADRIAIVSTHHVDEMYARGSAFVRIADQKLVQ